MSYFSNILLDEAGDGSEDRKEVKVKVKILRPFVGVLWGRWVTSRNAGGPVGVARIWNDRP